MARAIVLAGGLGTRLRPYTAVLPKPLMPIGDRPVLDIVVRQLRHQGFERVTLSTGYLGELVETFFGNGRAYGLAIDYLREETPLGTAGPIGLLDGVAEDFLLMNGDVISDLDYGGLLAAHRDGGAICTIATIHRSVDVDFGVLHCDDESHPDRLTAFEEKPSHDYEVSMGAYAFSPRVCDYVTRGERIDFPDLLERLIGAGEIVRAHRTSSYWLDIGRHDDYERAVSEFEQRRASLIPDEPPAEVIRLPLRAAE